MEFLTEGTVHNKRECMHGRIIKIGQNSKARRTILDSAVRRFFRHWEGDLPRGDFKIEDYDRIPYHQEFDTENIMNGIREARELISLCKSPYRELFLAAHYGALGQRTTQTQ